MGKSSLRSLRFAQGAYLFLWALVGCGPPESSKLSQPPDDPTKVKTQPEAKQPLSAESERLLRIFEDEKVPIRERTNAVRGLWKTKEPAVVDRLLKLLPDRNNLVTFEVLNALSEIGDPRALPLLESLDFSNQDKLSTALHYAIKSCKKNLNKAPSP